MTKKEKLRRKKIEAKRLRRKKMILRRRAYALLLLFVIVGMAVLCFSAGKKSGSKSVSGNNYVAAGAGNYVSSGMSDDKDEMPLTPAVYDNNYDVEPILSGKADVDLLSLEDEKAILDAAKRGMDNTVASGMLKSRLQNSQWHAISTTNSSICVFLTGHLDNKLYKYVYTMLNDGTYELLEISVDGEKVADIEDFLHKM